MESGKTPQGVHDCNDVIAVARGEFDSLLRVCANLTAPRPLEESLDLLLTEARRLVHAQAGSLYVVEHDRLRFVCRQNDALPAASARSAGLHLPCPATDSLPLSTDSLAGYVSVTGLPLSVADVYQINPALPCRFDPASDRATGFRTRSMLAVPLSDAQGVVAGVLQAINRNSSDGGGAAFSERDQQILMSLGAIAAVSLRNARLHDELHRSQMDTIVRLATAAEFRDGDTGEHIRRMSCYCEAVARRLGLGPQRCREVLLASPMHDVGKLGIPDAVLGKPGPLTPEERAVMQRHTTIGARILENADNEILIMARQIALAHHERWDGRGYPNGLAGEAIPLAGRIAAVADVFDALTNKRVYKPAIPVPQAFELIRAERAAHFDPDVSDAFLAVSEDVSAIHEAYQPV